MFTAQAQTQAQTQAQPEAQPPARLPRLYWHAAQCLAAGLLQALAAGWPASNAVAEPHNIALPWLENGAWLLQLVAAALFFCALTAQPLRRHRHTAALALAFAISAQWGVIWWIHLGMHHVAGLPAALSLAGMAGLSAYLAAYTVLASVAFKWVFDRGLLRLHRTPLACAVLSAAAFAGAWLLADLGRAMVMTGFPWASSGYAHVQGPLHPLAPWLGVYGVGAAAAFVAALLPALAWGWLRAAARAQHKACAAVAATSVAVLSLLAWLPDANFTQSAGEFDVALLQGNVSQEGKYDPKRVSQALAWHTHELSRSHADLSLTAETAFAVNEQDIPQPYWDRLHQRVQRLPGALLLGMPHRLGPHGQSNILLGLGHADTLPGAQGAAAPQGPYRYRKAHLVPFAEFTPLGFSWFTTRLNLPLPTFVSEASPPQPLRLRTRSGAVQTVAPLICFEDLYGEEVAQRFQDPALQPTVFANASNMAWFFDSPALAQHLRIARMRSLEFQRPTVRATNTGPTVVIDHWGQITRALPPQTQGVLKAVVEGRSGLTPYAWWVSRTGLWPLVALGLALLGLPLLGLPLLRLSLLR